MFVKEWQGKSLDKKGLYEETEEKLQNLQTK
jgi:hypothetical protein